MEIAGVITRGMDGFSTYAIFLFTRQEPTLHVSWTRVWPFSIPTLFHNGGTTTRTSLYTHSEPMKPTYC